MFAQSQSASDSDDSHEEQTSVLKRVGWFKSFDLCKSGGSQEEQEENNKHDLFIKMCRLVVRVRVVYS